MEETKGVAVDLTWEGLFPVVQEQRHVLRSRNRVTLDAQRFAQLASWKGQIVIDTADAGEEIAVDTATWIGTPDRSWGIRPIGEPEPAGRPADPLFEGMWWLCAPMAPAASPAARPGRRARSGCSLLSERNPLGSCWMMMTIAKSSNVIGNFKHENNHRHRHSALGYRTSAEYTTTCSHTHPVACEIN